MQFSYIIDRDRLTAGSTIRCQEHNSSLNAINLTNAPRIFFVCTAFLERVLHEERHGNCRVMAILYNVIDQRELLIHHDLFAFRELYLSIC